MRILTLFLRLGQREHDELCILRGAVNECKQRCVIQPLSYLPNTVPARENSLLCLYLSEPITIILSLAQSPGGGNGASVKLCQGELFLEEHLHVTLNPLKGKNVPAASLVTFDQLAIFRVHVASSEVDAVLVAHTKTLLASHPHST